MQLFLHVRMQAEILRAFAYEFLQLLENEKLLKHTLPTKVHLVQAMVFPVVMYGCESWTIKKAEP